MKSRVRARLLIMVGEAAITRKPASIENGLVTQWLEYYPDKIGVVGSNPTEPTKQGTHICKQNR